MAYPVTLNGRTYTLADFEGTNYVDGFPDALEDFVTQAGNIYTTTSTSSVAIGTGSKTFTVADSGKPYIVGTPLRIADSAAPSTNWIDGIVTSYSGTTLVVDAVAYAGSGTKTAWNINLGGGPIAYTGTLPIAQGGTGATTAAAARTNIDVYSKGEADSRFLNVSGEASDVTITGTLNAGTVTADGLTVENTAAGSTASPQYTNVKFVGYLSQDRALIRAVDTASSLNGGQLEFLTTDATNSGHTRRMNINRGGDISFYEDTGTTPKMVWSASAEKVEIAGSGGLKFTGGGVGQDLVWGSSSSDYAAIRVVSPAAQDVELSFHTTTNAGVDGAPERMRLDASGNVGIGTSSPSTYSGYIGATVSSAAGGFIDMKSTTSSITTFVDADNGVSAGSIGTRTNHAFRFNTNSTERMRITSTGNVGIGTSSPSGRLHVSFSAAAYGDDQLKLRNTDTGTGGYTVATFAQSAAGSATGIIGTGASAASNSAFRNTFAVGTQSNHSFTMVTNDTERMRIDASGNLFVGTTSGSFGSRITARSTTSYTFESRRTGTGSEGHVAFVNGNGAVGSIFTNGSATSYNTSSDYRLKEDVQPMTGASDRVLALKPVNFAWKDGGQRVDGFLAHEAQAVVPEAVTGTKDAMRTEEYEVTPAVEATYDEDGNVLTEAVPAVMGTREVPDYQGIDQSKLVPLLTAALQEALTEIADLKARITALEG